MQSNEHVEELPKIGKNKGSSRNRICRVNLTPETNKEVTKKKREDEFSPSPNNRSLTNFNKTKSAYLNPSGPGDYNLPPLLGVKSPEGKNKSNPSYQFGVRTSVQAVVSKDHLVSPGIIYNPDVASIKTKNPNFSQSKQQRFQEPTSVTKLRAQIPVCYSLPTFGLKRPSNQKNNFGSDSRFKYKEEEVGPGPAAYDQSDNSIEKVVTHPIKNLRKSIDRRTIDISTFGNTYDKYEGVYHEETEKAFTHKNSPGPCAYSPVNSPTQKKGNMYSFSKGERKLVNISPGPPPGAYDPSFQKIKTDAAKFSMGKSERIVDFSKYSAQHSSLVKKGLF